MISTRIVLFGFAVVSIGLLSGSLQHAAAQSAEEAATTSEPNLQRPALQLKLDVAGVFFTLIPSYGYTLEEMELRVKRAKIGLGVSAGSMVLGTVLSGVAAANSVVCFDSCPGWVDPVFAMGMTLALGGFAGTIASGILLRRRKRDLREAHYGTPHRVQWDLPQSRLVF